MFHRQSNCSGRNVPPPWPRRSGGVDAARCALVGPANFTGNNRVSRATLPFSTSPFAQPRPTRRRRCEQTTVRNGYRATGHRPIEHQASGIPGASPPPPPGSRPHTSYRSSMSTAYPIHPSPSHRQPVSRLIACRFPPSIPPPSRHTHLPDAVVLGLRRLLS